MAIQGAEECVRRAKRTVDRPWINQRETSTHRSNLPQLWLLIYNTSSVVMGFQLVQEDLYVAPADSAS
jgi:hypothetical protein